MNIEIKPRNPIKDFFYKLHDKLEDILFFLIRITPDRFIPSFIMNWINNYLTKRSKELQQEIIRQQWQQIHLEKAVEEIHSIQQAKEAQTED